MRLVKMGRDGRLTEWADRLAPALADFEALADTAFRRLPERFRALAKEVVVQVEDFPTEEICEDMGLDSAYELLGLYQGVSLDRKSVLDPGTQPDYVFLYRRPILDYWAENEETLEDIVVHVLIHEIGHHFGLSDDDMEHIEAEANP